MFACAGITDVGRIEAGHLLFGHPEKVGKVAMFIRARAGESFEAQTKL